MALLPTKEQIEAITDAGALADIRDELERQIAKIEVDLEFRPGDEDWAARARGALVAHNVCFGQVSRRIYRLERAMRVPRAAGSPEHITAKAAKKEAVALRVQAEADAKRVRVQQEALEARQKALAFVERTSWLGHFHKAAAKGLDASLFASLCESATARMLRSCRKDIGAVEADSDASDERRAAANKNEHPPPNQGEHLT